jgi:hypothetical protein
MKHSGGEGGGFKRGDEMKKRKQRIRWILKGDGRGLKFLLNFLSDHKIQAVVLI